MGNFLVFLGLLIVVLGLLMIYAPGLLNWIGKLPGDIRWQGERGGVFFPITSMIIVSVVVTIIINLIGKL
jgi:hypothetical protein